MADGQVDTSMYGNLQPTGGVNYLGLLGQAANIQNAVNQNRLFQQEFTSKQAVGGIMRQAIDEQGNVDYKKAAVLLSTDPRTGFIAPQILQQWANKGLLDAQTTSAELDNYKKRVGIIGDAAGALLNKPDLSSGDVISKGMDVYTNGGFGEPHSQAAKQAYLTFLQKLPTDASGKLMEGKDLRQYVTQIAAQADGVDKSMTMAQGALQTYDTGQGHQTFYQSATTGTHPGSFVPNQPSSADLNKPTEVTVNAGNQHMFPGAAIGQKIMTTQGQVTAMQGGSPGQVIDESGLQAGGNPANQAVAPAMAQGITPAAPPPQQGAQVPPPVTGSPVTDGAPRYTTSGLSPREESEQKNAAEYETNLNDSVNKMTANMQNIKLLQSAMSQTATGGGMELRGKLSQMLQAAGVPSTVYNPVAGGNLSANQIIQMKAIPQIFSNLRDLINGAGRFAVLEFKVLQENSPTIDTDPKAWKQMLGLTQQVYQVKLLEQQKYRDWVNSGKNPADWQAHWDRNLAHSPLINMPFADAAQRQRVQKALIDGSDELPPPDAGK